MTRQRLRARREELGLTQEEVAQKLHVDRRTYQRCEEGTSKLRVGLRPRLAKILKLPPAAIAEALNGNDAHDYRLSRHEVPTWLPHLASLERDASRIWAYEPVVVHGLLQTERYARAVESIGPGPILDDEVAKKVDTRLGRQVVLSRQPDPLLLSVVLDESVLHRMAGDKDTMAEQMDHLLQVGSEPNVTLRIMPLSAGSFAAAFGAFKVLANASKEGDEPHMACVEDRGGPHFLYRPLDVDAHLALFDHLVEMSLSPAESLRVIRRTAKELYL